MALIIALMATILLTALGSALIMLTTTETSIVANYRNAQEALYAADAGVARAIQVLATASQWNAVLAGAAPSGLVDRTLLPTLPDGSPLDLSAATTNLQRETDAVRLWGANNPVWRLYLSGPLAELLPATAVNSLMYVAVWIGDDPSETDGNPLIDGNDVLRLHGEAYGPSHTRKVVEVTVAKAQPDDLEGGMTAQRGQGESNRRGQQAPVRTSGGRVIDMRMNTGSGAFVVR